MCYGCYEKYGKPRICTDATRHAADLIGLADPWGPLHVVVEDDNYEDDILASCQEGVQKNGSDDDRACLAALMALSLEERASAMAIASGFIDEYTGADISDM